MKIGIEMRHTTLGHAGGVALLLKGVLETLFRRHPAHSFVVFSTVFNRSLLQPVPGADVEFLTLPLDPHAYFEELDRQARERGLDVLFRSFPLAYKLDFPLHRQVFLLCDVQHEDIPEFFSAEDQRTRRAGFTLALGGAGAIATISEFSRRRLLEQEVTRCRDIFVIPPALQPGLEAPAPLSQEEEERIPSGDFFLYPANLWPHKNHSRLFDALGRFLEQTRTPASLVLTGDPNGWQSLRARYPTLPIRHLGFVAPALLRALLRRARALVYFSLYEGFGMPLLEAFDAGTPVLCGNTTSIPEVGGEAVLTCDPRDPGAQAALMARVLREEGLRETLVARGKARLKAYTWEQSADTLLAGFERVSRLDPPARPTLDTILSLPTPPLVTIVTPSYNQGRFLRRTIDSVLGQTYPHIEYRVCDGGSTDESVEILKSYGDRFWWISELDQGQAHAINKGLEGARGSVRAYLNSDDVLLPQAVEKVVTWLEAHPECDLVYGDAWYIDEDDSITDRYATDDYSFDRLLRSCCICQPAAFWRARIAQRVGPFNESLYCAMDYDYWFRIDRAGGWIEYLPEVLACSRLYPETKTLSAITRSYEEIFKICLQNSGRVEYTHLEALWAYLCNDRKHGLPYRLRWLPFFQQSMAYLHHKWCNRRRHRAAGFALSLLEPQLHWLKHSLLGRDGPLRRLHPPLRWLFRRLTRSQGPRVDGFSNDNWLGPACSVALTGRSPRQLRYVEGIAPIDTDLTVYLGKHRTAVHRLRAGRPERIDLGVLPEEGRLRLVFSRHVPGPSCHRRAFLIQDTNLFTGADCGMV
jgi:glycosyltransferase involved in cell wall biosynthesis